MKEFCIAIAAVAFCVAASSAEARPLAKPCCLKAEAFDGPARQLVRVAPVRRTLHAAAVVTANTARRSVALGRAAGRAAVNATVNAAERLRDRVRQRRAGRAGCADH